MNATFIFGITRSYHYHYCYSFFP